MSSAFEATAERIAPSRPTTNYFDQAAGQDVIARYANSGRVLEDSGRAAEAANRLLATGNLIDRSRRDRILFDREDEEYNDKKAFKQQRGEFLESIAAIDPEADDFEAQISNLYKSLPQSALDDDAVVDLLSFKRKRADDLLNERQMQTRRQETLDDRKEFLRYKAQNDPRLNVLSPEERTRFMTPDGDFDFVGAGQFAYEKLRGQKKEDQKEIIDYRVEKRPDTDAELKLAKQHVADADAFPDQVDAIRKIEMKRKGDGYKETDLKNVPGYAEARDYESNKLNAELGSARNMSRDAYIALGGKSEAAKRKRGELYDIANKGRDQGANPGPAVGTEEDGYVFLGGNAADPKNWKKK